MYTHAVRCTDPDAHTCVTLDPIPVTPRPTLPVARTAPFPSQAGVACPWTPRTRMLQPRVKPLSRSTLQAGPGGVLRSLGASGAGLYSAVFLYHTVLTYSLWVHTWVIPSFSFVWLL